MFGGWVGSTWEFYMGMQNGLKLKIRPWGIWIHMYLRIKVIAPLKLWDMFVQGSHTSAMPALYLFRTCIYYADDLYPIDLLKH